MPTYEYRPLLFSQREGADVPVFAVFFAPAAEVLQWSTIRRLSEEPGAPQRQPSKAKINAIKRFLTLDRRNTIPTAITLSLSAQPDASGVLRINMADNAAELDKPGVIIDGQHRLLGISAFDGAMPVVVVALINASPLETAFQFVVINNKASRVSTDHIRSLVGELRGDASLEQRLKTARLSLDPNVGFVLQADTEEDSPFRQLIDWPSNREGEKIIVPAAIEAAIADIQAKSVKAFLESEDNLLEFFYTVWRTVKTCWPDLWHADSRLLDKVGIVCLNSYLADQLIALSDWGNLDLRDPDDVARRTNELLSLQAREFWTTPWASSSYDTRAGRELILDGLRQIPRNIRAGEAWHTDVKIVDPGSLGTTGPVSPSGTQQ